MGLAGRSLGLTLDRVTGFDVVTAAGARRHISYAPIAVARTRMRRARALIAPFGNGGAYPNHASLDLPNARRAYWRANFERLRKVKAAVDPEGRFKTAQGV